MSTTALLPMKANSERVIGKNFKILGNKPLCSWILDTLLQVPEIDRVVINTDATSILENLGIKSTEKIIIRERNLDLCGDLVSMNRIIRDDITAVPSRQYLMTHTTNPFLSAESISSAIYKMDNSATDFDSLFSVNRIQSRFYRTDGSAVNHDPDNLLRTQDLEPWFEENSCMYLFTAASFESTNARIGMRPIMFETPALESIDIDDNEDWILAECLAKTVYKDLM